MTSGSPDIANNDRRLIDAVTATYAALACLLGVFIVSAPLPVLLDRFIPDDAFYYLNTAKNFAASGFSSFDRIHFTNGYQPLWFLICVPIYFVFPTGGELPLRVMLVVQVICSAGAAAIMVRAVARWCGPLPASVAGLLWLVIFHRATINGLETAVHALAFAWLFAVFLRMQVTPDERAVPRLASWLGIAAAVLFLARTDSIFLVAALGVWLILQRRHRSIDWRRYATPVAVTIGTYLTLNLWTTGHLMPVSGAGKMYHSSVARAAAAGGGSTWPATLNNALWPISEPALWLLLALLAPVALLLAGVASKPGSFARRTLAFWPFVVATWATYCFYALFFYGGFSRTLWYYGPTLMVGWFALAALGAIAASSRVFRSVPWTVPFVLVAIGLQWLGGIALLASAVGPPIAARAVPNASPWARVVALSVVVATALHTWVAFAGHGIWVATWRPVVAVAAVLGGFISSVRWPRLALAQIVIGLIVPTVLVHAKNLAADLTTPPSYWNYHLLQGAEWARRALPPDAVIWSGSAGILGYFSDRRVVNTDGLANSYAFLENFLKARRLKDFVTQFDYAIDAYADESLQRHYPDGCFVPLPNGVVPPPFKDGALERQLRVFQMHAAGIVSCR